jgi:hypothetical protein
MMSIARFGEKSSRHLVDKNKKNVETPCKTVYFNRYGMVHVDTAMPSIEKISKTMKCGNFQVSNYPDNFVASISAPPKKRRNVLILDDVEMESEKFRL